MTVTIWRRSLSLIIPLVSLLISPCSHSELPIKTATEIRLEGMQESIESQVKIDQYADQTLDMAQEFQQSTVQLGDLKIYNNQLEKLVIKQREELASFDRQMKNAKETQHSIVPMMLKMLKVLEKFISLDAPFLKEERSLRISALKELLDDPETSLPEKYRRILEAYQIEADYGRTIESYHGEITLDGKNRSVEFLRLGRVTLLYASLDGNETGYWDKDQQQWRVLPSSYNSDIDHGLRIARKESPPELIKIPLSISKLSETATEDQP